MPNKIFGSIKKFLYKLYLVEIVVLLFLLFAFGLYFYLEIPLRAPLYLYSRKVCFAVATYLLGLFLCVFFQRLEDIADARKMSRRVSWANTLQTYRSNYLGRKRVLRSLRCMHAIGLMFAIYINLKHLIPFVNHRVYDSLLAGWELTFFGGISPTTHLISLFGTGAAPLLSYGYTIFYPYVAILSVAIVLQKEERRVYSQSTGFVLLWLSAVFVEYAIPTLGPCFSNPELISSLPLTKVSELQADLWRQKEFVMANPKSELGVFLISGVPSLHFALVLLGTAYLYQINRILSFLSFCVLIITAISTIYFAWHFVVDLVAAAALVAFAWRMSIFLSQSFSGKK